MNSRVLGLVASLFVGAGWAAAQGPAPTTLPSPPAAPVPANMPPLPQGAGAPRGGPAAPGGALSYPAVPTLGEPVSGCNAPAAEPAVANDGVIFYTAADYLLWQVKKGVLPTTATAVPVGLITFDISHLVTFSPACAPSSAGTPITAFAPASITNQSTFGAGPSTKTGAQNGGRFTFGGWVDQDMSFGVEAQGLFLERGNDTFAAVSAQGA